MCNDFTKFMNEEFYSSNSLEVSLLKFLIFLNDLQEFKIKKTNLKDVYSF